MHTVSYTGVCMHVSLCMSAGSATVGQLAVQCEEFTDMRIHTYWLTRAYMFICTLQSMLSSARAVFDMQLENVFKSYRLEQIT